MGTTRRRPAPGRRLHTVYDRLLARFGPRHWWPGETTLEIIVGAILTQNTAWVNVEQAIANLRRARRLSLAGLRAVSDRELARLIRPSGYFNQKVKKLRAFLAWLDRTYGGSLARWRRAPTAQLREELLGVWGLGPETVDSILLYALDRPVFVVDAYTRRIFARHGFVAEAWDYHRVQDYFTRRLPADRAHYNEYHALIVNLGKEYCRPTPNCTECPLRDLRPRRVAAGERARRKR